MVRKVICTIKDSGEIDVVFVGEHLLKRDLLRLLRAIRLKYRQRIRIYRMGLLAKLSRARVEIDNNEIDVGAKND